MALRRSLKPSARDDFADAANRSGRPTATQEGKAPSRRPTCHEFAGGSVITLHAGMHQKREKPATKECRAASRCSRGACRRQSAVSRRLRRISSRPLRDNGVRDVAVVQQFLRRGAPLPLPAGLTIAVCPRYGRIGAHRLDPAADLTNAENMLLSAANGARLRSDVLRHVNAGATSELLAPSSVAFLLVRTTVCLSGSVEISPNRSPLGERAFIARNVGPTSAGPEVVHLASVSLSPLLRRLVPRQFELLRMRSHSRG